MANAVINGICLFILFILLIIAGVELYYILKKMMKKEYSGKSNYIRLAISIMILIISLFTFFYWAFKIRYF